MSGQNTTYINDTFALELQEGINLSYYYLTSMTALPLYDCLITFGQEINVFWTRNPRPKSMYLFYLNRFALIFLAATNLANQWLFTSTEDCKISTFIQTIAEILQYVVLAAVAAFRVYALGGHRWYLCALTFLLALFPSCEDAVYLGRSVIWYTLFPPDIESCTVDLVHWSKRIDRVILITGRLCVITSELMVVVATILKTYGNGEHYNINRNMLSNVIFRHGLWYFLSITLLYVTDIVLVETYVSHDSMLSLTLPIASILVSRFLLDVGQSTQKRRVQLRSGDSSIQTVSDNTLSQTQSMCFVSPSDNMALEDYEEGCSEHNAQDCLEMHNIYCSTGDFVDVNIHSVNSSP